LFFFFQSESTSDGILIEENFLKLLSILAKGSLDEQFYLCLSIVCPKENTFIKKDQLRSSLDILYRITFNGTTPYEVCSLRLDEFVQKLYSNEKEEMSLEKLKELLQGTHLLDELWTQLFLQQ